MELEIRHTTKYTFSEPVFLEPHVLRFQPRADGAQLPLDFDMDVDPPPAGAAACLDASGNSTTVAWFDGLHDSLTVSTHAAVRMLRDNPFDYLLDPCRSRLPVNYGAEHDVLRPYLQRSSVAPDADGELAAFAARMRDAAQGELVPMLTALNHTINARVVVIRRDEGASWPPERTWREKCGACRDLAVLFVDVCRSLGVAARFVSGYEDAGQHTTSYDLHAWAEAYIPRAGWRGYDPTRGLATAQSHVAVAAAASAEGASPVSGSFRGTGVASRLESEIRIEQRAFATIH